MQKINFKNLPDTSTPLNASTLNQMQDNIETAINSIELSGGGDEIGTVKMFSGSTAPQGWLICDGSAISRSEYVELFSAIGTTYGSGNGTTTFNIPNIKGRTIVGLDSNDSDFDTLGETGGSKNLQEHTHNNKMDTLNNLDQNYGLSSNGVYADRVVIRSNNTDNNSLNSEKNIQDTGIGNSGNLQPYIVLNYIIKASATTTTQGQIIDSLDGSSTTDAPSVRAVNTLKPVELYNNSTGSNGTITLNDSSINYEYIEIFYGTNEHYVSSVKVYSPNNKDVCLMVSNPHIDNVLYIKATIVTISSTTITPQKYLEVGVYAGGNAVTNSNLVYIHRVIGYK